MNDVTRVITTCCDDGGGSTEEDCCIDEQCQDTVEQFCEYVENAIRHSDCLCDGVDGVISESLATQYKDELIQRIVDIGRCENKARIFYFNTCEEVRDRDINYMCCPKKGDMAIIPTVFGNFDTYILEKQPTPALGYVCGTSIPDKEYCDQDAMVWIKVEELYFTKFERSGNNLILTRNDGFTQTVALPVQPEERYFTNFTRSGNNLVLTRNDGLTRTVALPAQPEELHFTDFTRSGNNLILTRNDGLTRTVALPSTEPAGFSAGGSTSRHFTWKKNNAFGGEYNTSATITIPDTGVYLINGHISFTYDGPTLSGTVEDHFEAHSRVVLKRDTTSILNLKVGIGSGGRCSNNTADSTGFSARIYCTAGSKIRIFAILDTCLSRPMADIVTYTYYTYQRVL